MSATIVKFPGPHRPHPDPEYPLVPELEPIAWDDRVWLRRALQQGRADAQALADMLTLIDALIDATPPSPGSAA